MEIDLSSLGEGPSVTFEHPATGFWAAAPADFKLTYHEQARVYELISAGRDLRLGYARMSGVDPLGAVTQWAENLGCSVVTRTSGATMARVETSGPDGQTWTFEAQRASDGTVKATVHARLGLSERSPEQLERDELATALFCTTARGGSLIEARTAPGRAPAPPAAPAAQQNAAARAAEEDEVRRIRLEMERQRIEFMREMAEFQRRDDIAHHARIDALIQSQRETFGLTPKKEDQKK